MKSTTYRTMLLMGKAPSASKYTRFCRFLDAKMFDKFLLFLGQLNSKFILMMYRFIMRV